LSPNDHSPAAPLRLLRQAMAVDHLSGVQGKGGVYLGNTAGNLFASNDLGETWQTLPGSLPGMLCVEVFASPA
ncbi:MAG: hypothetical protein ACI9D0_001675, partial [Bacteroidia bacterium]